MENGLHSNLHLKIFYVGNFFTTKQTKPRETRNQTQHEKKHPKRPERRSELGQ